jgi:hypothetical protein
MTTITVTAVMNEAAILLFDTNNIKWSRAELLNYINTGQRSIVAAIPEASSQLSSFPLLAGTRQVLPPNSNLLLDVTRNLGFTAAQTPGRAIKRTDMIILDETNPTWSSDPAASVTTLYMHNLRDRYAFYVYPQAVGNTSVEVNISVVPIDIQELSGTTPTILTVGDMYQPALLDYILWRCYSKAAPFGDAAKTDMYYKSFAGYLAGFSADAGKMVGQMGNLLSPGMQGQGSGG